VPSRRAPEHGEHNDEVLAQLGFSADDIAQLREQKVIPVAPEQETVL
jgi:formyl-CoA transferase